MKSNLFLAVVAGEHLGSLWRITGPVTIKDLMKNDDLKVEENDQSAQIDAGVYIDGEQFVPRQLGPCHSKQNEDSDAGRIPSRMRTRRKSRGLPSWRPFQRRTNLRLQKKLSEQVFDAEPLGFLFGEEIRHWAIINPRPGASLESSSEISRDPNSESSPLLRTYRERSFEISRDPNSESPPLMRTYRESSFEISRDPRSESEPLLTILDCLDICRLTKARPEVVERRIPASGSPV